MLLDIHSNGDLPEFRDLRQLDVFEEKVTNTFMYGLRYPCSILSLDGYVSRLMR